MKLIFMGTPGFTLPVLDALHEKHEIMAILLMEIQVLTVYISLV